jgi:hypothetical protein
MTDLSLLVMDKSHANDLVWSWARTGWAARGVRGLKMRSGDGLMDEFAAALQFPWYFGENWGAFDECLSDMDEWMLSPSGIAVLVYDAAQVLIDESPDQLEVLVRMFRAAAATYAAPIAKGEAWDRPAVPFHIVLQAEAGDTEAVVRERWTAAGANLVPLTSLH